MSNNSIRMNARQEIDKLTAAHKRVEEHMQRQMDIMAEEMKALQDAMQNKDQLSKLRGWAIDRAIAIAQINKQATSAPSFQEIKDLSEELATYAYGDDYEILMKKPEPLEITETVQ